MSQEFKNSGPIYTTQAQYNALVQAGTVEIGREYRIVSTDNNLEVAGAVVSKGNLVSTLTASGGTATVQAAGKFYKYTPTAGDTLVFPTPTAGYDNAFMLSVQMPTPAVAFSFPAGVVWKSAAPTFAAGSSTLLRFYYDGAAWHGEYEPDVNAIYNDMPNIQVAACTGMGIVKGTTTNILTWIDPDNVVLNGATLTRYEQTDLVVADGHEPTSTTDGTVIATTNRLAGTKNQYQYNGFVHSTTGYTTPYYKLFTKASSGKYNNLTANLYPSGTTYSWGQVANIVAAGSGPEFFPVGTIFTVDDSEYTHINGDGIYMRVVGHDQVPAADASIQHTMCLDMTECLFLAPFDQGKLQYALTADLLAITGKTYYTRSGTTYTALVEGVDWNAGDPVPMASWYERGNDVYNYWPRSNMRQWANSDALANQWYTPQSIWDQPCPTYVAKNGFMRSLDPAFKAALTKARLTVGKVNVEGGGYTTCDDFFFPLSAMQIFNQQQAENVQLAFYAAGGEKRKTLMGQSAYSNWWTRSAFTGYTHAVWYATTSGACTSIGANYTYGVSLACIIGKQG